MSKKRSVLVGMAIVLGLLLAFAWWQKRPQPDHGGQNAHGETQTEADHAEATPNSEEGLMLSDEAKRNIGLATEPVQVRTIQKVITINGIVKPQPDRVARVSPRIEGLIEKTYVAPFDWVAAGQRLAEVRSRQFGDPPPLVPLTAPLAGLITRWEANIGESVDPSKVVFEIVDPKVIWVEGDLPEHEAGLAKIGQPVRVRVVAIADESFDGRIVRMGGSVEPEKRTVHVWAEVANPRFRLKPEMFAEVTVVVGRGQPVLSIPRSAVLKTGGETFVFVQQGERFLRQNVSVGAENDRYLEIQDGLFEGDVVVSQGGYELMSAIFIQGGAGEHGH